jgi:inorganic pyrophosphatase
MRAVSDPIKEGAEGFLKVQYAAIMKMAVILCFIILGSYTLRPSGGSEKGVESLGNGLLGFLASLSFVAGAACSAFVGYLSMWVSASTNIRVCSAARRSYMEALETCFRGGAFSAVLCITLCVFGVSLLFLILHFFFVVNGSSLVATGTLVLLVKCKAMSI